MTVMCTGRSLAEVLVIVSLGALAVAAPVLHAAESPTEVETEYGVTLAFSGHTSQAESVFVSLLSIARGDARALNNLGNLRLLRGELGVALAFYDRALRGDSADGGIHLNRATALLLMGDESRSIDAATAGVRLAGGVDAAGSLIGLKPEAAVPPKAAQGAQVSKDEIRVLLRRAAARVPSDTSRVQNGGAPAEAGKPKIGPTWRSAGSRASDDSDAAMVLYWKR